MDDSSPADNRDRLVEDTDYDNGDGEDNYKEVRPQVKRIRLHSTAIIKWSSATLEVQAG